MTRKPTIRKSLLTGTQVLWTSFFILALWFSGLGLGRYTPVDPYDNRILEAIASGILPLTLYLVAWNGPSHRFRTLYLWLCGPFVPLMIVLSFLGTSCFNEHWQDETEVGNVTFVREGGKEISYEFCQSDCMLFAERHILNNTLKEKIQLLDIRPCQETSITLIDGGEKVRFFSPQLRGRKAIIRTFPTDWEALKHVSSEFIEISKEEIEAKSP